MNNYIHKTLQPLHEQWCGKSLVPTACYGAGKIAVKGHAAGSRWRAVAGPGQPGWANVVDSFSPNKLMVPYPRHKPS
jgi:hypothetical protein